MSEASDFPMTQGQAPLSRDNYPYLTDAQWGFLEKMFAVLGRSIVAKMLEGDPSDIAQQIDRFGEYEKALEQHVIDAASARFEALRQAHALATPAAPVPAVTYIPSPAAPPSPKPVRISVTPYAGLESENLVFWLREVEMAMAAGCIHEERQRITFAISNMKDRAKTWALTCETANPGCFDSFATLASSMKAIFQPPNIGHRQRAAFLASQQGDRELYAYVQELRQLRASMAANALAEDVMLTVFMDNMKNGPSKAAVFREEPKTLEQAFTVALREDDVQKLARGLPAAPTVPAAGVPGAVVPPAEPMDLSVIDLSGVDLSTLDLSAIDVRALHVKCFTCDKLGHYQRDCPRNRGSNGFRARRGRGRGRQPSNRGGRGDASQGNASSQ